MKPSKQETAKEILARKLDREEPLIWHPLSGPELIIIVIAIVIIILLVSKN